MATAVKRRSKRSKPKAKPTATKVYSYIRFSTPEQAEGDSERRQVEKAQQWAEKHGYTFDESLRADRGVPSFRGANRKKGNFGTFLQRVQNGEVPSGSILVVEELRRLTREGVYTGFRETIFKLFDAGITNQTLSPELTYNRDTINNMMESITLTVLLQLAHEESKQKSEWLSESWKAKRKYARENGKVLTSMAPDWFKYTVGTDKRKKLVLGKDGKPIVIPEAAKAIIIAYRLREKGLGAGPIARHLNAKSPWTPPAKKKKGGKPGEITEGWNSSYVKKILMSRAVIGEYQPCKKDANGKRVPDGDLIPDYYPNLFANHSGLFEAVQKINKENAGKCKGGRNDKANNILQKLAKCAYCGGSMHFQDKSSGWRYLKCANGMNGKTECKELYSSIPYMECEDAVIEQCRRLRPEQVLPNEDDQAKLCKSLRQRLQRDQAVEQSIQEKIDSVNEQIKVPTTPERRAKYNQWLDDYDAELAEAKQHTADTENKLHKAEHGRKSLKNWQANIESLQKALATGDVELRQRMNAHLKEFIDHIDVFTDGYRHRYNDDDDSNLLHYFDAVEGEIADRGEKGKLTPREKKNWNAYKQWAQAELRTKRARFMRVYFKQHGYTGEDGELRFLFPYIDIAPEGSIGGSSKATETLWEEFKNRPKKRGVR